MFRDGLMHTLAKDMKVDVQAYRPAVVFINGEYWGIHNIRERYDTWYLHTTYGVDRDKVAILEGDAEISDGTVKNQWDFVDMRSFIEKEDMTKDKNYEYVKSLMDIENFIDYNVAQIYFANTDWPSNNVSYWKMNDESHINNRVYGYDGKWRWMIYDTDFGYGAEPGLGYSWGSSPSTNGLVHGTGDSWSRIILTKLLDNIEFRNDFINRFADTLNTNFSEVHALNTINHIHKTIKPEIEEHINRRRIPESVEVWEREVQVLRNFAMERPKNVREHILDFFCLSGTSKISLATNATEGIIRINSLEVNEELIGNSSENSWTGVYFKDVPIEITAQPKPGYRFVSWEGVEESHRYSQSFKALLKDDLNIEANFELDENDIHIDIPDANLRNEILKALGKKEGDVIFSSEMKALEVLDLRDKGISNIEGLQYAKNLKELNLRENHIEDISPLQELFNLEVLTIRENKVSDITPLSNLLKLKDLSIHTNKVKDISPLKNLVELEELTLRKNKIEDITPLKGLTKLRDLNIRDNKIKDIKALEGLKNIKGKGSRLNLDGNPIKDFSPLKSYFQLIEDVDFVIEGLEPIAKDSNPPVEELKPYERIDTIKVTLDGELIEFDQEPVAINGRVLVPVRAIYEALGLEVAWDSNINKATGKNDTTQIDIILNQKIAYVNETPVELDVPARAINNRILVPARFIGESLGMKVTWDGANQTVKITSNK